MQRLLLNPERKGFDFFFFFFFFFLGGGGGGIPIVSGKLIKKKIWKKEEERKSVGDSVVTLEEFGLKIRPGRIVLYGF